MNRLQIIQILPMYHPDGEVLLNSLADVKKFTEFNEEEIIEYLKNHRVDGIILRAPAKITPAILDHCKDIKAISGAGVGLDNIAVDYATKKGIPILHAPKINTGATAEHAVSLLLAVMKNISQFNQETKMGNFAFRDGRSTLELSGKTIGLIGFGTIAQKTAKILVHGFEMKALAYVRNITEERITLAEDIGVELTTSMEKVFQESDAVSLHIPLTEATSKLVDERLLSMMKPSAVLINTARGGVINENDLAAALKEKRILGAGIDVFTEEPPQEDHPFFNLDNVTLTPHMGGISLEATRETSTIIAKNLVRVINGETLPVIANHKALQSRKIQELI
ncbi:hydroxyacid dehydrogenase [Bacillus dakarensis]|uniref:hydroxyacid dehydrogenase n=1 Tax=Robertmurraya dakarensis TaxID=1926278 RepID=UPI000980AD3E|nr:hydroxyacid dehydrogenase [Bacillus dakarensis]